MSRLTSVLALILSAGILVGGCGDDDDTPNAPSDPPTEITETFSGMLTRNGAVTHPFTVQRAGAVTARITALEPSDAVVGLSIGPLSGQGCSQSVANDNATSGTAVIGNASVGSFCVRVFDAAGTLPAPVDYTVTVTHF